MALADTDPLTSEIRALGEQTRQVAARYEGVHAALRRTLSEAAASAANPADGARAAMVIADTAAEAFGAHFPNQPIKDCHAGCDACCHLYVMIPPGVADLIAEFLTERLDKGSLKKLRTDLQLAARAADALADPKALRHRCPLLGSDGLCTVYEVRPPACRAFTSSSVAACRSLAFDPEGPVASIPQNPSQFRVYVEATDALEQAARARGARPQQVGLAAGILARLPESEPDL
jgi:Fe-S-cluster containining protein